MLSAKTICNVIQFEPTYLIAQHISGVLANARQSHVRTLASDILVDPPLEVGVVREVDEAHGQGPYVPLEQVRVRTVIFKQEAYPALS